MVEKEKEFIRFFAQNFGMAYDFLEDCFNRKSFTSQEQKNFITILKNACVIASSYSCAITWEGRERQNKEGENWRKDACKNHCQWNGCCGNITEKITHYYLVKIFDYTIAHEDCGFDNIKKLTKALLACGKSGLTLVKNKVK